MKRNIRLIGPAFILLTTTHAANAATAWVGTATYPGQPTTGEFDSYDFGAGIALIQPNGTPAPDVAFEGYYQTMVDAHFLGGIGVNVPNLTISGDSEVHSPGEFELTLRAHFSGIYTQTDNSVTNFVVTGGNASVFFDDSPDYSFSNDSGFGDGIEILGGTILTGVGSIIFPGTVGAGVQQMDLSFDGGFDFVDSAVFDPSNIAGGSALFSIKTQTPLNSTPIIDQVQAGNNTVMGQLASNGILTEADGTLNLTAVPVPPALALFSLPMLALISISRRRPSGSAV